MLNKKDSIEFKTVIPYPKKKVVQEKVVTTQEKRETKEPIPLYSPSQDSVLQISLSVSLLLLLLMHLYTKNRNHTKRLFLEYFSLRKREEGQMHLDALSVLQHLFSFIVLVSLGYYFAITNSFPQNWKTFSYIAIGLSAFMFVRTLLIAITGYFTGNKKFATSHHGIVRFINKILGLFLLPLVVLGFLLPQQSLSVIFFITIALAIIKISVQLIFVYKLLRARKFSVFHSFLYLCTLEVLPIIYIVVIVGFLTEK